MTRGLDPVERLRWLVVNEGLRGSELVQGNGSGDDPVVTLTLQFADVARSLRVSPSTVKRMVRAGELPVVEVGGMPRVRMRDLWAYVDGLPVRETRETT